MTDSTGQNRSHAVMAQRHEAADSLDYFPTPPWATRALCEHLDQHVGIGRQSCWEPAAGAGHMARPLAEYFRLVAASDIAFYGASYPVLDFLEATAGDGRPSVQYDWLITNPPFNRAAEFALRGLAVARVGVALMVRTVFLEGGARWRELFQPHPPTWVLQFSERAPMIKGRLDRAASSATAYCWVVWTPPVRQPPRPAPALFWFPPGTRARLECDEDYR